LAKQIIAQTMDKYERDLMRIFNCSTDWPMCLYDFTCKNKNPSYLVLRVAGDLTDFAFEEYFFSEFDHISLQSSDYKPFDYWSIDSRDDLLIERSPHLCNLGDYPFFTSNFKTRYSATDPSLIRNPYLTSLVEEDTDIPGIQLNFVQ